MFVKPQAVSSPIDINDDKNKSKMANVIDLKGKKEPPPTPPVVDATCIAKMKNDDVLAEPTTDEGDEDAQLSPPCSSKMATSGAKQSQVRKIPVTKHFLEEPFELELAAPLKTKTLTLKKKNSLIAKRRLVSLKTLDTNDIQGHLYRRAKDRHGSTYWARYYFVLVEYVLYGFRTKESTKADFLIFLSGFTVSLAKEVHSKPFAFKVYHPSKSFYFAAETATALSQWMEYIKLASMKGGAKPNVMNTTNWKELFSETDSSDDDLDLSGGPSLLKKHWATPSPSTSAHKSGGGSDADSINSTPVTTTKAESGYHLNFGSLKKFAKSSLAFSNSSNSSSDHNNGANSNSSTNVSSSPSESKFLGEFDKSHLDVLSFYYYFIIARLFHIP
jgi:connector enhancer of kinase suppressor of Ras 2